MTGRQSLLSRAARAAASSCSKREASTTLGVCATVVERLLERAACRRPLRGQATPSASAAGDVLGRGQAVRRGTLDPVFGGSNPPAPTSQKGARKGLCPLHER
jgi:hypothetical protein